jgi:hypothetical protein
LAVSTVSKKERSRNVYACVPSRQPSFFDGPMSRFNGAPDAPEALAAGVAVSV